MTQELRFRVLLRALDDNTVGRTHPLGRLQTDKGSMSLLLCCAVVSVSGLQVKYRAGVKTRLAQLNIRCRLVCFLFVWDFRMDNTITTLIQTIKQLVSIVTHI